MINSQMRFYDFFTLGDVDAYGQPTMPSLEDTPIGSIKMSINTISQTTTTNIKYQDATYIGLTHADVNDTYIIDFNGERLKVMYVNDMGRLKQVYLKNL